MFRLSKKVEYALLALQYLTYYKDELVSAKEMADNLNISFEFLSKTMQTLMKYGLVQSHQGIHGGYSLTKLPGQISLAEVIKALDFSNGIVECLIPLQNGNKNYIINNNLIEKNDKKPDNKLNNCDRIPDCTIRDPFIMIQNQVNMIFKKTTIEELVKNNSLAFSKIFKKAEVDK